MNEAEPAPKHGERSEPRAPAPCTASALQGEESALGGPHQQDERPDRDLRSPRPARFLNFERHEESLLGADDGPQPCMPIGLVGIGYDEYSPLLRWPS